MIKRVLSLDGGGARALVFLQVLKYLEQYTGRPTWQLFDFVCGTSTGGIAAVAFAAGHTAAEVEKLYLENLGKIFDYSTLRAVENLGDLIGPKYSADGLEQVLKEHFPVGTAMRLPVAVCAYDTRYQNVVLLDTTWGPLWQLGRATSAAPTYFPPFEFGARCYVDGGLVANDPTLLAAGQACERFGVEAHELRVVSLGTGFAKHGVSWSDCHEWGALQWVEPLIDTMLTGSVDTAEYAASRLLPHYHRFNCMLTKELEPMDVSDVEHLTALQALGLMLVHSRRAELDELAGLLVARS